MPSQGPQRAPQFLLIGIDTTPGPLPTHFGRRFAEAAARAGAHVTFFSSTQSFLLHPSRRGDPTLSTEGRRWIDPRRTPIRRIAYAASIEEIVARRANMQRVLELHHEVACHGVHHENGRAWTTERWRTEFRTFFHFHEQMLGMPRVHGFRAPYLASRPPLQQVERELGFLYDASTVRQGRVWPRRFPGSALWEIAVQSGWIGRCNILFFDDGLFRCHVSADYVLRGLIDEFEARYGGTRAPLILSSHQGFVENAYLPLLERVCGRPDVRCATFTELATYMNEHPELAGYGQRASERQPPTVQASERTTASLLSPLTPSYLNDHDAVRLSHR